MISYIIGPLMALGITGTSGGFGMNFPAELISVLWIIFDFCSGVSKIAIIKKS